MKKRYLFLLLTLVIALGGYAQGKFKDVRQTYLWDVTLSMKGYNGAPDIYDKVVDVMVKDIQSVSNERTEIVVIPFQEQCCDIWREYATPEGKAAIIKRIKTYDNSEITSTSISAPLEHAISNIFSADKIDIMKLMTDGNDNVNPTHFRSILADWCDIARTKDAYGYYILLADAAKNGEISLLLKGICNFEEIDVTNMLGGIAEIRQINAAWKDGILINIRDEYDKPKKLKFNVYSGDGGIPAGYKIHFKTRQNPYLSIDEVVEIDTDNSVVITPRFLKSQQELMRTLPILYDDIVLEYTPAEGMNINQFAFTRLLDNECAIILENKPVKTVVIDVKK